ncbi:MAG: HTH domain-containing protein [Limisphaerales bacterium]
MVRTDRSIGWKGDPRLHQVLEIMKDGKPHKAGEIAYTLGVHSRTIRRAVHRLRDEAGFNIETRRDGFVLRS